MSLAKLLRTLLFFGVWLGSCQSPKRPDRITAENYRAAIPDPKTLGETYVSDSDHLLQASTVATLNARLDSLDRSGRAHIDVVLVKSIGTAVPKTAAYELFNQWKIGNQNTDNGLLMLLVEDQRRVEFETGYGLEADLPDAVCGRIQRQYMVPAARAGDYDAAVQAGVAALIRRLQPPPPRPVLATADDSARFYVDSLRRKLMAEYGFTETGAPLPELETLAPPAEPAPAEENETPVIWLLAAFDLVLYLSLWHLTVRGQWRGRLILVPLTLVAALLLVALGFDEVATPTVFLVWSYALPLLYLHGYFGWVYRRTRRPDWPRLGRQERYAELAQAHHHLGFTAFLFPVLLAAYWLWHRRRMQALRDAPMACPQCGQAMRKLVGEEEKAYLAPGQQAEETLESVDYDLWQCPACAHYEQLTYANLHSVAQQCPACHHRTFIDEGRREVKAATITAAGWGWHTRTCRFCHHQQRTKYTIARQSPPSSSGSSSGGSSFSSSGSSSSSSTSSGGSSGGGGAGSSW